MSIIKGTNKTNTMKKIKIEKLSLNKVKIAELSQGSMKDVKGGKKTVGAYCTVLNTRVRCLTVEAACELGGDGC